MFSSHAINIAVKIICKEVNIMCIISGCFEKCFASRIRMIFAHDKDDQVYLYMVYFIFNSQAAALYDVPDIVEYKKQLL